MRRFRDFRAIDYGNCDGDCVVVTAKRTNGEIIDGCHRRSNSEASLDYYSRLLKFSGFLITL